ncbi:MAG: DUF4838 domain-containing protein [Kiritimatiellae bacterium]|nr:DUF4838 domain-containing protein [Kiritimatiellia bacterium]
MSAVYAATDLQEHLALITGALVPIVTEEQPVTGIRILVGESAATRALGYDNASFTSQAYRIDFSPNGAIDTLMLIGNDKSDLAISPAGYLCGSTNWIAGAYSDALSFDGASALTVPYSGFTADAGTMECWVCLKGDNNANGTILRLDAEGRYHLLDRLGDNKIRYCVWDGIPPSHAVVSTAAVSTAVWHHLLATYDTADGGKIELFVDGVSQGTDGYGACCGNAPIRIGGVSWNAITFDGNGLVGDIDEVRLSSRVRDGANAYQDALAHAPYPDDDTTLLLHLDSALGMPIREYVPHLVTLDNAPSPEFLTSRGTCYAVYDFLERYCGMRWYNPTAGGMWGPAPSTLTVSGSVVARASPYEMRVRVPESMPPDASYNAGVGALWTYGSAEYTNYLAAAYPGESVAEISLDVQRFLHRRRAGGKDNGCSHSFYGYYARFHTNHPTWFADYYRNSDHSIGTDSQLCYSNPEVIAQVVQDAVTHYGVNGQGDDVWTFSLGPMDNYAFCTCSSCTNGPYAWSKDTSGYFSNGGASDYIFNFVNQVVTNLHAIPGHENDRVSEMAYDSYAAVPTNVTIAPCVEVHFCFSENRMLYNRAAYDHELGYLAAWTNEAASVGRKLGLWLYPFTPEAAGAWATSPFKYFPGYYAHSLAAQFGLFSTNFCLGIYLCGAGQEVENYVSLKLLDDPTLDVDALLGGYFSDMYGPAAAPMSNFYNLVEATYTDLANHPPVVATNASPMHQTEEYAWGWLGTASRMAQLQAYMTEAINAAGTGNAYANNVNLFRIGTWEYMQAGRAEYLATHRPPTVTITSPGADAVITGAVAITADATDDIGVGSVAFYADGVLLGTDTDGADGWSWLWSDAAPGAHRLLAVATDYAPMHSNAWHHVMATHDAPNNRIELFVDGVSQGTANYAPTTCNDILQIGGVSWNGVTFAGNGLIGDVDEVRLSSCVRDGWSTYTNQPPVQDGGTVLLRDLNALPIPGATTIGAPELIEGNPGNGNALRFSATNVVQLASSGFADSVGAMEAWVRLSATPSGNTFGTIFRLDGNGTYHILERVGNDRIHYVTYNGGPACSVMSLAANSVSSDPVNVTVNTWVKLIEDGFETNFNQWTDGGATDWDRATSQKHAGSYSAHAGFSDNDLISDNLQTAGKTRIRIEFWYRDDDIDDDDNIYLQLYNGSTYANRVELGITNPEDTWHKCDITINNSGSDAQYFRSSFRIKFEATSLDYGYYGADENLWIDDVTVSVQ